MKYLLWVLGLPAQTLRSLAQGAVPKSRCVFCFTILTALSYLCPSTWHLCPWTCTVRAPRVPALRCPGSSGHTLRAVS